MTILDIKKTNKEHRANVNRLKKLYNYYSHDDSMSTNQARYIVETYDFYPKQDHDNLDEQYKIQLSRNVASLIDFIELER